MAKEKKRRTRIEPFAGYENMVTLTSAIQEAIKIYEDDPDMDGFEVVGITTATSEQYGYGKTWSGTLTYRVNVTE